MMESREKMAKTTEYLLENMVLVLVWRGTSNLLDLWVVPNHPTLSSILTLLAGCGFLVGLAEMRKWREK